MASLEKLKELELGGIGTKTSVVKYMNINILTAFTSAKHPVFGLLAMDSNTQAVPVTSLQKSVAKIWPEINADHIDRGTIHVTEVAVKFHDKYLRQGKVALMSIYESSSIVKDAKGRSNPKQFYVNVNKAIRQLLDYAHKHNLKIGMPRIGSDRTWSEIESIIEDYASKIGYQGQVCVFDVKRKKKK